MENYDGYRAYLGLTRYVVFKMSGAEYLVDSKRDSVYRLVRVPNNSLATIVVVPVKRNRYIEKIMTAYWEAVDEEIAHFFVENENDGGLGVKERVCGKVCTSNVDRRTPEEIFAAIAEGR